MAFKDAALEFSVAQTIATAVSTNVVSLLPIYGASRDIGPGQDLYIQLSTPTAMSGTNPTLTVAVQASVDEAFTAPVVLGSSKAFTPADFAKGLASFRMPSGTLKYVRLSYTAGGTVTAGTVTAGLTEDAQSWSAAAATQ